MLRFCDSTDGYAAIADVLKKWNTAAGTVSTAGGRFGAGALQVDAAYCFIQQFNDTTQPDICIGFSLKVSANPSTEMRFLTLTNQDGFLGANTYNAALHFATNGRIGFSKWGSGAITTADVYSAVSVTDGAWHWIEFRFKMDSAAAGTARVYIDGSLQIDNSDPAASSLTGTYTAGGLNQPNRIYLNRTASTGVNWLIDDLVIYDDVAGVTGDLRSSVNFPLGDSRIEILYPTGAGSTTQWTPNTGANYAAVDEAVSDEDTTYVQNGTSTQKDLYAFGNLSGTPATVHAVVVNARGKSADAGAPGVKGTTLSAAAVGDSASMTLGAAYRNHQLNIPIDPNTSAAWTGAAIDAAEFGVKTA